METVNNKRKSKIESNSVILSTFPGRRSHLQTAEFSASQRLRRFTLQERTFFKANRQNDTSHQSSTRNYQKNNLNQEKPNVNHFVSNTDQYSDTINTSSFNISRTNAFSPSVAKDKFESPAQSLHHLLRKKLKTIRASFPELVTESTTSAVEMNNYSEQNTFRDHSYSENVADQSFNMHVKSKEKLWQTNKSDATSSLSVWWYIMAPISLRFPAQLEEEYANFIQLQIAQNLWWALLVLISIILIEYLITSLSTPVFLPLSIYPQLAYTISAMLIFMSGISLSFLSTNTFFSHYLEICIAAGGSLFSALLILTSDHFRVATLLGYDAASVWGRTGFSDGPLLLGLTSILLAIALFLPVRSICLWPVCLSTITCYQFATFCSGSPDGLRATFLNVILLILLSYLALTGRRVLEAQLRMQFLDFKEANCRIAFLEKKISQYQQKTPTTLEWLFQNLNDSIVRVEYVFSCLEDASPALSAILQDSVAGMQLTLAHLSRIDSLLSVNINAILGVHGDSSTNDLNDTTKSFIKSTFLRKQDNERVQEPSYNNMSNTEAAPSLGLYSSQPLTFQSLITLVPEASSAFGNCKGVGVDWNFNMLELDVNTNQQSLVTIGTFLMRKFTAHYFGCDQADMLHFLLELQRNYMKNPYHNAIHGAEVCHSMLVLLNSIRVYDFLDLHEQAAVIIAALAHDVSHPGRSNAFQVNTNSEIAITYNDLSVLEQFHAAKTFSIINTQGCNFCRRLSRKEYGKFRQAVIELILETDMTKHFESISKFKVRRQSSAFSLRLNNQDRWQALKLCIKAADIGHSAKTWPIHFSWTTRCTEEFFLQGDEEVRLGLPVSPLCDREKISDIPKSQAGFIQFVCVDLFEELAMVEETMHVDGRPNHDRLHTSNSEHLVPTSDTPNYLIKSPGKSPQLFPFEASAAASGSLSNHLILPLPSSSSTHFPAAESRFINHEYNEERKKSNSKTTSDSHLLVNHRANDELEQGTKLHVHFANEASNREEKGKKMVCHATSSNEPYKRKFSDPADINKYYVASRASQKILKQVCLPALQDNKEMWENLSKNTQYFLNLRELQ